VAGFSRLAADRRSLKLPSGFQQGTSHAFKVAPADDAQEGQANALAAAATGWSRGAADPRPTAQGHFGADRFDAVAEVLREPGRPLAPDVGSEMKHRLGRDFTRVRIHDGATASAAAASVSADAFATGNHIVFSAGLFQPHSRQGRFLLAHELAHSIQQGDAAPSTLWRQAAGMSEPTTTTAAPATTAPPAPTAKACPPPSSTQCGDALRATTAEAVSQLDKAETALNQYAAGEIIGPDPTAPERAEHRRVGAFLNAFFNTSDPVDAEAIAYRIARIRNALSGGDVCMTCDVGCGAGAGGTIKSGYSPGPMKFVLCGIGGNPTSLAATMIHECAHAVLPDLGVRDKPTGDHRSGVLDRAYHGERLLTHLSTVEAMTNAESYAELVQGLNRGGPVPTPAGAEDKIKRCPDRSPVESGLGRAQVAARRLTEWLTALLETMRRDGLTSVEQVQDPAVDTLRSSFPSFTTIPRLEDLTNDAGVVFGNFTNPEWVTCATSKKSCPEGRLGFVDQYTVTANSISRLSSMIDKSGSMNLCPSWFSVDEADRTRATYAMVASGYLGGARVRRLTPDDAMRLASLALVVTAETLPPPVAKAAIEHLTH
jgi:hypothetical protein